VRIARCADLDGVFAAAADEIAGLIRDIAATRGVARVALAGGATPIPLYARLAPMDLPWDRVELWFGDERMVPPDHEKSNYRMARTALLDAIDSRTIVHRIRGELGAAEAADLYEHELVDALATPPRLDVVLLGLGTDGHTASLFPYSPALGSERWVVATSHEPSGEERVTLTERTLAGARHVRFLVTGTGKAGILAEVLEGVQDPRRLPAQRIATADTDVSWFVDHAAAALLRTTP